MRFVQESSKGVKARSSSVGSYSMSPITLVQIKTIRGCHTNEFGVYGSFSRCLNNAPY